jgi:hypothetical protein
MPSSGSVETSATAVPAAVGYHRNPQLVEASIVADFRSAWRLRLLSPKLVPLPIPAQFFVCSSRLLEATPG